MKPSNSSILLCILCAAILATGLSGLKPAHSRVNAAPEAASQIPPEVGPPAFLRSNMPPIIDVGKPAVAYNTRRDEYLVVWEETHESVGAPSSLIYTAIYGFRIDRHGSPIGSAFPIISANPQDAARPALAYSSIQDKFLVVFEYNSGAQSGPPQWDIRGRIVNGDGSVDASVVNVPETSSSNDELRPAIAYNSQDDEFLVAYQLIPGDHFETRVQRIAASDWSYPAGPVTSACADGWIEGQ